MPTESPKPFVHLHVHTQYSLLDGATRMNGLIERAKRMRGNGDEASIGTQRFAANPKTSCVPVAIFCPFGSTGLLL